jgi:murein L,D-transpeptidase YafK
LSIIRWLFRLTLLTAVAGIALFMVFPDSFYRTSDRAWMAMRHLNRVLHYQLGYQLPGTPDLEQLDARLAEAGLKRGDAVFMRVFKSEMTLELWMQRGEAFTLFATYPICYWSGRLGPKLQTGDHQAPEGFYTVGKGQLNPNSRWHRSFDLGFPNQFDRGHGRTGSYLMVHGGCSSVGCYAMTNGVVDELWRLLTAALDGGQERFGVHIFPFRPTEAHLAAYADHRWAEFLRELKPGYDLFEASRIPPEISICRSAYAARPGQPGASSPPLLRSDCPPPASPAQS